MEMKKSMCLEEKLVLLRKEQGLSQTAAAERLEISRQAISRWEMGSAVPTAENLKCLSELYQVPVDVLLDDSRDIHTWREEQRRRQTEPEQSDHKTERKRAAVNRRTAVIALALVVTLAIGFVIWREEQRRRQTEPEQSDHKTERKRAAVNRRTAVIALALVVTLAIGFVIGMMVGEADWSVPKTVPWGETEQITLPETEKSGSFSFEW